MFVAAAMAAAAVVVHQNSLLRQAALNDINLPPALLLPTEDLPAALAAPALMIKLSPTELTSCRCSIETLLLCLVESPLRAGGGCIS